MFNRNMTGKLARLIKTQKIHPENSKVFYDYSSYKHCIILGSSPSINNFDLTNFEEELIITMGNFHEHPEINKINPSIHIFAASHPPITSSVLRNWWKRAQIKLPKNTIIFVESRDVNLAREVFVNREVFVYTYGGNFPIDFTKRIISPWSVTQIALQFTLYCKIKNTYLIGIDHDWQSCKPYTHFFSSKSPSLEYFLHKEGIKTRNEQLKQPMPKEKMYRSYELYQFYEKLKEEAKKLNLNVYNIDDNSHFDVFERKYYSI